MPIQYTGIFKVVKKLKISIENLIFLLKTQIIGTRVLTSTHNLCFGAKIRKIGIPLHYIKVGFKGYILHGHVILMLLFEQALSTSKSAIFVDSFFILIP